MYQLSLLQISSTMAVRPALDMRSDFIKATGTHLRVSLRADDERTRRLGLKLSFWKMLQKVQHGKAVQTLPYGRNVVTTEAIINRTTQRPPAVRHRHQPILVSTDGSGTKVFTRSRLFPEDANAWASEASTPDGGASPFNGQAIVVIDSLLRGAPLHGLAATRGVGQLPPLHP